MRTEPERVYLRRRRPCWECSKPLRTVTTGPNKGKYSAVLVEVPGFGLRLAHATCALFAEVNAWRDALDEQEREREARFAAVSEPGGLCA